MQNYIGGNKLQFIHPEWLTILKTRTAYAFPLLWSGKSLIYLFILLSPLVFSVYIKSGSIERRIKIAIHTMVCIATVGVGFQILFTSIFPLIHVVQLQLGRILFIPILLSVICIGGLLVQMEKRFNLRSKVLLAGGMLLLAGMGFMRRDSWFIQQKPEWVEAQKWIAQHTTKECTVLVNFYSTGFRVYGKRSIVGEYKDGTLALYSEKFAYDWNQRQKYIEQTDFSNLDSLQKLQHVYPFSLVVLPNDQVVPLPSIFRNQNFSTYQMPVLEPLCIISV